MLDTSQAPRASAAVLACLSYAICSTTLTLANKHIFSHDVLNYPWSLIAVQSTSVTTILIIFQLIRRARFLSLTLMRQMLLPCLLFTAFIYSNSKAFRFVSLPVLSVIKSLGPMGIALLERLVFGDTFSGATALSMVLVVAGNAVTMFTDLEYSFNAYGWALANVVINIAYLVSLRACLTDTFSPVEKAIQANMAAATIMLSLSFASGETLPFIEAMKETDTFFRVVYVISCLFAAGIGASIFWVVQTSSGSTLSFVGTCNKFFVVIFGGILFKTRITPLGWVSVTFGVLAGALFTIAKARDSEQTDAESRIDEDQENDKKKVTFETDGGQDDQDAVDVSSDTEEDAVSERLL